MIKGDTIKEWIKWAPIGYVLATPVVCIWSYEAAGITLVAGALLAVLSKPETILELSVFGFKAKLEKALDETHAKIEQVKELAKTMAHSSLSNTARSSWLTGIPPDQQLAIYQTTISTLKILGITQKEIDETAEDFHNCTLKAYRQMLIGSEPPSISILACNEKWEDLRWKPVNPPTPPKEIEDFFEKFISVDATAQKRLDGYRHYFEKHEFLDFDDYNNASKPNGVRWPKLIIKQGI